MIDLRQTIAGVSVGRARLLSEGKVWIDTFRNDTAFRAWVLDLIKEDQLREQGIDEDGNVIGYYSFVTSLINPEKAFNTHYTLDDSGYLLRSLVMAVTMDYFELSWDDAKIQDQDWYTPEILGFTDENLEKIAEKFVERLGEVGFALLFENL